MYCDRFTEPNDFGKTSHFQRRIFLSEKRKLENSPSLLHHDKFASTDRDEGNILNQYFYGFNDH